MWLRIINEAEDEEQDAGAIVANLQKLAKQGSKKAQDALDKMQKKQSGKDKGDLKLAQDAAKDLKAEDDSGDTVSCKASNSNDGVLVRITLNHREDFPPSTEKIDYERTYGSGGEFADAAYAMRQSISRGNSWKQVLAQNKFKKK